MSWTRSSWKEKTSSNTSQGRGKEGGDEQPLLHFGTHHSHMPGKRQRRLIPSISPSSCKEDESCLNELRSANHKSVQYCASDIERSSRPLRVQGYGRGILGKAVSLSRLACLVDLATSLLQLHQSSNILPPEHLTWRFEMASVRHIYSRTLFADEEVTDSKISSTE